MIAEPSVSVLVATREGDDRIHRCLDSLVAQTLDRGLFEIVVIQNGPPCDTPRIVSAMASWT